MPSPDTLVVEDDAPTPRAALPIALARLHPTELVALLAVSMSLGALGIDLMLPAFADIRLDLGLAADSNATAGLITTYFFGLAVGQLVFGVLADGLGRRRALYIGYVVYGLGALASVLAPTLPALLAARALWGLGAAGGRVVTIAVVRDTWSGDRMSRAMSFVLAVFILVPIVSPAIGAAVLLVASWRWVLGLPAIVVAGVALWAVRLPETLPVGARRSMRPTRVIEAARIVVSHRVTVAGGVAMVGMYAAFTSWIASAELIVDDVFDRADSFPLIFGGLATVLGLGMLLNARLVDRFGTRRVTRAAIVVYVGVAAAMVAAVLASGGQPGFWAFAVPLALLLGCHALLVPNVNSIAMEPVGEVAGTASALLGAVQVAGGAILGSLIDRAYDGTVQPLAIAFLVSGVATGWVVLRRLTSADAPDPTPAPTGHAGDDQPLDVTEVAEVAAARPSAG